MSSASGEIAQLLKGLLNDTQSGLSATKEASEALKIALLEQMEAARGAKEQLNAELGIIRDHETRLNGLVQESEAAVENLQKNLVSLSRVMIEELRGG